MRYASPADAVVAAALAVQAQADAAVAATIWANSAAADLAEWLGTFDAVRAYALSHEEADH